MLGRDLACALERAIRPSPHGIFEPPLKRYAMQIVFDIGILLCRHVLIPVGTTFERKGHFMIIGYGRTSTIEQVAGLEAQIRDLKAAGAEKLLAHFVSAVD